MPLKKTSSILVAFFIAAGSFWFSQSRAKNQKEFNGSKKIESNCITQAQVCFTPGQACTDLITETLRKAKQSIHIQAFSFTSRPIAQALIEKMREGIEVKIIFDSEILEKPSDAFENVKKSGISIQIDRQHQIAHNKVMIVDQETVITGSFNFTRAAQEKNAENVLVLRDLEMAQDYLKNWEIHSKHSEMLRSGTATSATPTR
ncbi:MAG: phospholipase D family protein [Deltaproteobacteria bacterium]|nr:phospholipase D family protein [Deltaproteobacteria bacterium]